MTIVIKSLRAMSNWDPQILTFDIGLIEALDPLCRELGKLCFDNQLGWARLAFFAQINNLPLEKVTLLSKELVPYGVELPCATKPDDTALNELEMRKLSLFFRLKPPSSFCNSLELTRRPALSDRAILSILQRFEPVDHLDPLGMMKRPERLDRRQGILLSRDSDDAPPYLPATHVWACLPVSFPGSERSLLESW